MEHAFTHRPPPKKKRKKSPHPSLHLLQLDKISRLCSAVALIGRGGGKQAFDTNTGSAFTYLGACLSVDVNAKEV